MIRNLPGDILVTCQGTPAHTFTWLGHHTCPECRAALPIKTAHPIPLPRPQDDPTAILQRCAFIEEAIDQARRARARWRIESNYYHHGAAVKVTLEGDNSSEGRKVSLGRPYHVIITYRLDTIEEHLPTRQAAFMWLVDHLSTVPLWPWWMFQKER